MVDATAVAEQPAPAESPPTRQPVDPTEGGSTGPEDPAKPAPVPPVENPDPGIEQHPTKAPPAPPVTPPDAPKDTPPVTAAAEVKYDLKLPDNSALDPSTVERIAAFAKARGLTPDVAQATLEQMAAEVAHHREQEETAFKAQVEQWQKDTASDASLGKTPEERQAAVAKGRQVLDKYEQLHPERGKAMKTFLDETGFREHPAVVGFFAWLGKAAGEGPLVIPSTDAARPKSAAEIMYGPDGGRAAHEAREAERRARAGG